MGVKTIPILPSNDFDGTAAFYAPLGFRETGRWPGEYLVIKRDDGIELHFWFHARNDPSTNDVACYIRFDSAAAAQALHDEWAEHVPSAGQIPRLVPPSTTDYGLLELALIDPQGNLLRVGGSLS